MTTHHKSTQMEFEALERKKVVADFTGGQISSDGGGLLLREIDKIFNVTNRLVNCFNDFRKPDLIDHSVRELVAQRIYTLALGYEDLNDHNDLSRDPLLATVIGKQDPLGKSRKSNKDKGIPLASPSTLGRIERTKENANQNSRYEKVVCDFDKLRRVFTDIYIESWGKKAPKQIILDIDPSDIELHGNQELIHYHGYYGHNCYLPIYLFIGEYPIAVKLRPSDIDGAKGVVEFIKPVIKQLRKKWPKVKILLRADSGFCREELMEFCEAQKDVDYLLGMGRNSRLKPRLDKLVTQASHSYEQTGKTIRFFQSFGYRTLDSWSRVRRVIGKAECNSHGSDIRFVVTSLKAGEYGAQEIYEKIYCARGEMENRIKEQQLDLFGIRASSHTFRANHLRVWWSMAAHLLIVKLRDYALPGTKYSSAQAATLRVRLLKIGALVEISVRRIHIRLSSAFPQQELFFEIYKKLRGPPCCVV